MTGYNMPPGVNEADIDRAAYGTCETCGAVLDGGETCPSCGASVASDDDDDDESDEGDDSATATTDD